MENYCACGCGKLLHPNSNGKIPRYAVGHNSKVAHPTAGKGKKKKLVAALGPYYCACGCGGEITPTKNGTRIAQYLNNHDKRGNGKTRKTYPEIFCACGCGQPIKPNSRRQLSKFISGHNSRTPEHLTMLKEIGFGQKTGADHPNWKGGTAEEHDRYYYTQAWAELRTQCFERDQYTCQRCGAKKNLRAHHIHFRRTGGADAVENLTTLCHPCHMRLHNENGSDSD